MKNILSLSRKVAVVVLAAFLFGAPAAAEAQTTVTNRVAEAKPAAAEEPGVEPLNWITTGIGGVFTSGDRTQFQERWGMRRGLIGGLQDFHYEMMFGKKGMLDLDGNAMYGGDDYSVRLKVADPDRGFVRGGYHQFRRWYDGSGGFYPPTGTRI